MVLHTFGERTSARISRFDSWSGRFVSVQRPFDGKWGRAWNLFSGLGVGVLFPGIEVRADSNPRSPRSLWFRYGIPGVGVFPKDIKR